MAGYRREKKKFCFFWRSGPFTQWYPSKFKGTSEYDESQVEREFCNAEQWMMYNKALLFGDVVVADDIMQTTDPKRIKALGRKAKNFSEPVWVKHRQKIVYEGNKLKFTQNESLLETLLGTGHKTFVEASPSDKIWGIGMTENDPNAVHPNKWRGLNLLGQILTQLRDELSGNETNTSTQVRQQYFPDLDRIDERSE